MPGPGNNIRGRYSIHFHRGGSDPNNVAAHVEGCSVTDDPGWAYVNHSSKVDFIHNVSYDVVGGAFQTEAGDETGSFIGNIAIRTVNPDDPMQNPSDTNALVDLRENWQDFAWQGDAFWIHGGGVVVDSNIASGASGHAFIYWPEGLIEANSGMMRGDKSRVPNSNLLSSVTQFDIWWIPLASAKGNTAYSATKGLSTYYLHTSFLDPDDPADAIPQSYRNTLNSTFEGMTMWAMRQKMLDFNYTENISVKNSRFIGHGAPNLVGIDANHFHNMEDLIFENNTIEGFDIGFDVPSNGRVSIKNMTMNNTTDFRIRETQWQRHLDSVGGFGRDMRIENINYLNISGTRIQMAPDFSLIAEIQDGLDDEEPKNLLWFLLRDKIILNYGPFQNSRLYFDEQAAAFVPITNANDSIQGSDDGIEPQYVNKTNQELQTLVGSSLGGSLLPSSALAVAGVVGGKATNVVVSLEEGLSSQASLLIYPNPLQDVLNLKFETTEVKEFELQIWTVSGSLVYSANLHSYEKEHKISFSEKSIPKGTYILKVMGQGNSWTSKIVRL